MTCCSPRRLTDFSLLRVTVGLQDEPVSHVGEDLQPDRRRPADGGRRQVEKTRGRRASLGHGRRRGPATQRVTGLLRLGVLGPRGRQTPPEPQQQLHGRASKTGKVEL